MCVLGRRRWAPRNRNDLQLRYGETNMLIADNRRA